MINERQDQKDAVYSSMAREISKLSKDENTKIGAVIVAKDGTPISWGYNGTVSGFDDLLVPHSREVKTLQCAITDDNTSEVTTHTFESNKYPFMSHAESNAIFYGDRSKLVGATIYVTGFPCENCALQIARAKIVRVVVTDTINDANSTVNKNNNNSMFILAQHNIRLTMGGKNYTLACRKNIREAV